MIVPTAAQMLKTVERTIASVLQPELTTQNARSAAATVGHMLRIATLRVEVEGQLLHDERAALNELLPRVAQWLVAHGRSVDPAIAARPPFDPTVYPSLGMMAADVGALRQGVCAGLAALRAATAESGCDASGSTLLEDLRGTIARQLEQEGRFIDPATQGFGPRR
ncbi:hypothetical protein [Novosphingobium lentum]|uniref:hypothetical protein n=1 Tax=Novosphingobium lentum TaxID=145287 RepID=UPI00082F8D9F|nr:hypothetical protein [Novosphingobium lentum]